MSEPTFEAQDDESHWHRIPESKRKAWDLWLDAMQAGDVNGDYNELDFDNFRLDGGPDSDYMYIKSTRP